MKAIILAAGEGRRLEPLTEVRPKPMIPVANRPLLEHVVEALVDAGIEEVVLVVGYERERIQSHFEDGDDWGITIEYAIQEKQLGTGHAILQAERLVDDTFLVLNGDRIIDPGLIDQVAAAPGEDPVVSVTRTRQPSAYGVVEVQDDHVVGIEEKPPLHAVPSELINAGVYRFTSGIFDEIRRTETGGELAITATLDRLADLDRVRAVRYRGTWLDVSYLWDVIDVTASVLDRDGDNVEPSAHRHERATITESVAIGADSWVGPGAIIMDGSAIGDNVTIGPNAVIENTVIFGDVVVEAGAVLTECVVGQSARVGANATVAGGEADVVVDETLYPGVTLGGVIGDTASLGGGVSLQAGAVVGNGATIQDGATVDGRIPDGAIVRRG